MDIINPAGRDKIYDTYTDDDTDDDTNDDTDIDTDDDTVVLSYVKVSYVQLS